tara:strand:+ start:2419 stop:3468 length:1050 start_codon:yes stop_codon:yes gene_type:complete
MKKNTTGTLYGKYSHGNQYDFYFSNDQKKVRKKVVQNDLSKAKYSLNRLVKSCVMNVGTGRESYALHKLGAKYIYHYDISKEHVKKFKQILKEKKIKNIKSQNLDLCLNKIPKELFDFVYLNGIVHHFSDVSKGLDNCAKSVKLNGKIWVYFYRSGTFKWFICQMIRELLNKSELINYFKESSILFSNGNTDNASTTRVMDDFFAPYIWMYTPKMYCSFMREYGFILDQEINSKNFKDIDFNNLHHSSILVFERKKILEPKKIPQILSPASSVNQLNIKSYKNKKIIDSVKIFNKIKKKLTLKENRSLKFSLLISLHKLAAPQYYGQKELPPRQNELNYLLKQTEIFLR